MRVIYRSAHRTHVHVFKQGPAGPIAHSHSAVRVAGFAACIEYFADVGRDAVVPMLTVLSGPAGAALWAAVLALAVLSVVALAAFVRERQRNALFNLALDNLESPPALGTCAAFIGFTPTCVVAIVVPPLDSE